MTLPPSCTGVEKRLLVASPQAVSAIALGPAWPWAVTPENSLAVPPLHHLIDCTIAPIAVLELIAC